MGALLIFPIGAYIACIVVCLQKGKTAFGLLGLFAAFPPLAVIFGWFPIFGAIRFAKPSSSWAKTRYDDVEMAVARQRFPDDAADEVPRTPTRVPQPSAPVAAAAATGAPPASTTRPLSPDRAGPQTGKPAGSIMTPPGYRGVVSAFLFRASKAGVVDAAAYQKLKAFLDHEELGAPGPAAAAPPTTTKPVEAPSRPPQPAPAPARPTEPEVKPVATPVEPAPPKEAPAPVRSRPHTPRPAPKPAPRPAPVAPQKATPPPPREPSPLALKAAAVWNAIASDIALHGFAYLGVLLTLVGVLGFLLFAFADLETDVKPFVELFIAFVFFGWAWLLRRQDAVRVAAGMDLIGKILLPLIVFAGLVDSAPFPPDFEGNGLIVALTVSTLVLAALYALLARRNASSLFRYLVAPLIWLSAMTIGLVFKTDEHLVGDAITRLVSMQPALAAAAIAATLLLTTRNRDHLLARPTVVASLIGLPIAYLLTVSLEAGDGWDSPMAIAILGAGTLVSAELLTAWFDQVTLRAWLRPVLLAGVVAPLVPTLEIGWAGLVIALAYLGVGEWTRRSTDAVQPLSLAVVGASVGAAMSVADAASMLATFSMLSAWAHTRRFSVSLDSPSGRAITGLAAGLPVGIGIGLVRLLPDDTAWLIMALVLAVIAVAVFVSRARDVFWSLWPSLSALIVALGAIAAWDAGGRESYVAVATVSASTAVIATGRSWGAARVWITVALSSSALGLALETALVEMDDRAVVWAAAGLAAIAISVAWHRQPASHLATAGHLIGVGSLLFLADGREGALVLGAWAAGWLATVAATREGWDSLTALLVRATAVGEDPDAPAWPSRAARWLAPVVMAASIPPAVLEGAGLWERFDTNRSWTGVALGALAMIYAVVARRSGSPLRRVLAIGAITMSIIGVAVAAPESLPIIATASSVIAVAAILTGDLRSSGFVWFAWIVSVLLAMQIGRQAGVGTEHVYLVSLVYGAVLLLGGLVLDQRKAGGRAVGDGIRIAWLRRPVLIGAAAVPLSLGPVFTLSESTFGWASIGAGVMYFVVAFLLRVGTVSAPGYGLTVVGIAALSPWSLLDDPWRFVLVAAPMVLISQVLAARQKPAAAADPFLRWDLAPLIAAHAVAGFALIFGVNNGTGPATAAAFGALSVATGLLRRNRTWLEAGNALLIAAALGTGGAWPTLALAATAVRGVIGTGISSGTARVAYQWTGVVAAAASWISLVTWQEWTEPEIVSATALAFGALSIAVAVWLRFFDLPRDTTWIWGGLAAAGVSAAALDAVARFAFEPVDGPWLAIGMTMFGAALLAGASKLGAAATVAAAAVVGAAWPALSTGLNWDRADFAFITALSFGALSLLVGAATRLLLPSLVTAASWMSLGAIGVGTAGLVAVSPDVDPLWGPAVALGFGALAIGLEAAAPTLATGLRYGAVGSAGLAWLALTDGMEWSQAEFLTATPLVFGGVAVAIAATSRLGMMRRGTAIRWGALGAGAVTVSWLLSLGPDVAAPTWKPAVAVGLVMLALGFELATPVIGAASRYLSVATAGPTWLAFAQAAGWSRAEFAFATTITFGAMAFVLGLGLRMWPTSRSLASRWGALATAAVAIGALSSIAAPGGQTWAPGIAIGLVLLAAGLEMAHTRLRSAWLHYAAVVATGSAWVALSDGYGWTRADFAFLTALVFGATALLLGLLSLIERTGTSFTLRWGALAAAGVGSAAVVGAGTGTVVWAPATAAGLVALGLGAELAARRTGIWLQYLSVVAVGSAWPTAAEALGWADATFAGATSLTFGGLAVVIGLNARLMSPTLRFLTRWGSLAAVGVAVGTFASLMPDVSPDWAPSSAAGVVMLAAALHLASHRIGSGWRHATVVLAGIAWLLLVEAMDWTTSETLITTTVLFAPVLLAVSEISRILARDGEWQDRPLASSWFALAFAAVALATVLSIASNESNDLRWGAVAAGAAAVGMARAARPLRVAGLRSAAGPAALVCVTLAGFGLDASDAAIAIGVVGISVLGTAASLSLWQRRPGSPWMTPVIVLATTANIEAAGFSLQALPDRALLVTVLFSIGIQALATGMSLDRAGLLALGPPVIGAAFILMVAENVSGSAQWYTAPIGLVLLGEVEVLRKVVRDRELSVVGPQVAGLEWVGVGLLGAPPLVEMFVTGIAFGLIAFAVSALLLVWAIVTKVRRRAIAAASLAIASGVLTLFAGAAAGAPDNAFFWIVAVGVGFSVMLVAALIEAYRSKKGRFMEQVEVLMEGWE